MLRILHVVAVPVCLASLACDDLKRLYTENSCCGAGEKALASGGGGGVATCGAIPQRYLDRSCCETSTAVVPQPAWEKVFDQPPFGLQAHHTFAFVLHGAAYFVTGNLRKVDGGVTDFSDAFYRWSPQGGFSDLGPFPGGKRGYAIGDVMQDTQTVYFGFGMTRLPEGQTACRHGGTPYRACGVRTSYPRLRDLWSFDGNAEKNWTRLADNPAIGRTHPALLALRGKIYMGMGFGELLDGSGKSGDLRDAWMYDVQSDSWTELAPLPRPAHHPFQFSAGGQHAYVMFGHNLSRIYNDVYRHRLFVDGSDAWERMASLPGQGRVAGAQFSHAGRGFVLGGEAEDTESGEGVVINPHDSHRSMATGEFWSYDPAADTWAQLPPAPGRSRWAATAFVLDDHVYMLLGSVRRGHGDNTTEEFPATGFRYYLGNCTGPHAMCSNQSQGQGHASLVGSASRGAARHAAAACLAAAALRGP
mmetsp:Transcript_14377/g.42789  ORF Transcript_14377/g.42789 Transcript_14377/m.42789 type:complete len:474 (+) Transcript_14377:119-1540(+)